MDDAAELQAKGDEAGAFEALQKAIAMDPEDARVNFSLGGALTTAGRSKEAIPYLKKATQVNPDFLEAYYSLGAAQMREQNIDEAIAAWNNRVRINPRFFQAQEGLGFAFYVQGKYADSLAHLLTGAGWGTGPGFSACAGGEPDGYQRGCCGPQWTGGGDTGRAGAGIDAGAGYFGAGHVVSGVRGSGAF